MSGLRIIIDGTPAQSRGARIVLEDGHGTAEVQVAHVGREIVVVVAGLYGSAINDRGHLLITVAPTPGSASGPDTEAVAWHELPPREE